MGLEALTGELPMLAMSHSPQADRVNILILDDHADNLTALRLILDSPDYSIFTAANGPEALKLLLKRDFALVLVDVLMPKMDGFEFVSILKQRKKTRSIPVIFLTAIGTDVDNIFKAYSLGAVDYIQKPFDPHVVRSKVAVFAELHRKNLEIQRQAELLRRQTLRESEHRIERIQRAGEERFRDLVEGISHGFVWSADPETLRFSYVSPRAELILGYPVEQWLNEPDFWIKHVHPDDTGRARSALGQAQAGRDLGFDHRFITPDGGTVWLNTGIRLARRGDEAGYELRGLSVDVTHLKETERELTQALQTRDEFLSIASHELKTPITPLKLQLQSLARNIERSGEECVQSDRLLRVTRICNSQINRLSRLVDDLLDVSRIRAGKLMIQPQETDLSGLVQACLTRHSEEAAASGCELRLEVEPGVKGEWDPGRIEQVILNLVTNAIKYAPGSPIEVRLQRDDSVARLTVRDFGKGIPESEQKRVFERFERAQSPSSVGGLGLGLYIARRIVEAHDGSIRTESPPDGGAAFVVELPLGPASKLKDETHFVANAPSDPQLDGGSPG